MLFNSFHFCIFFPLVFILYFSLPYKYRWHFLLAASCYFYVVYIPYYILILAGTIVIDYFAGIIIENSDDPKRKKIFLIFSIIANVGVLAVFKYFNFFINNINDVFSFLNLEDYKISHLDVVLPIGLSFHTFQAMSYTIEVYRGNQKAERSFITYALYVMFFPQLVAGPIERPYNILPQLHRNYDIDYGRIIAGLKQMLWGFFKKIVIADTLAVFVNQGYGHIENHDGISLLLYTYFFAFQIYCDFSGYSDIAIGAAKVLGINLMENFRTPYFATSIKTFWQRWHISLSSWFRDYMYIPLGGNRAGEGKWYFNLIIVFLISGFWHGANWTFIIWGALHGLYMILGVALGIYFHLDYSRKQEGNTIGDYLFTAFKVFFTFNLVALAWVFFRANNVSDALWIIYRITFLVDFNGFDHLTFFETNYFTSVYVFLVLFLLFIISENFMDNYVKQRKLINSKAFSYLVYVGLLVCIMLFGHFRDINFIYFQF